MRMQLTSLTSAILFASSIQVLPPLFKQFKYVLELLPSPWMSLLRPALLVLLYRGFAWV